MSWDLASHEGLPYRFALPPGYDPQQRRYPLWVYLHGSGERGDDTTSHLKNGVEKLLGHQAIVVAPQCPRDDTWGGSWYGGDSKTQQKLVSLVRELGGRRSVDAKAVSLVGFSMGAIGLWSIVERYRDLFVAGVPISGDLDLFSARGLTDFPLWAFHGAVDPLVKVDAIREVAAAMKRFGSTTFRYTEFPDVGHDAWRPAFDTPELVPWLLKLPLPARAGRGPG